ncbi:MAG: DMT family transporter [Proteobacteria bacterium]|nr:DMT family transporter [Pseudomonadota bacterium]MDA1059376.1 DMT family transporter [Pseudomonadota bacterium]
MDGRSWAGIALLGAVWGSSFFFFEVALDTLGPITVAFARVAIAALALLALLRIAGDVLPTDWRSWRALAIMGVLNNAIPFTLIAWAQVTIEGGLASILNATTPIFSVVLAVFVARQESLTTNRLVGVLLGFSGVIVLIGPGALSSLGVSAGSQGLVLLGALSYATAAIFARRHLVAHTPLVTSFGQVATAALVLLPLALVFERPWEATPTLATWGALLAIGTLGTAFAYPLYFLLLRRSGATNLMLVTLINPVTALLLGILILGENPDWTAFAGMGLIFAGLATIDGRLTDRLFRPSSIG